ncbi:MAG: hypothetical protein EXS32_14045 [Opitutus sp.]|nr:hypothetical protein [Opitutus sp.]
MNLSLRRIFSTGALLAAVVVLPVALATPTITITSPTTGSTLNPGNTATLGNTPPTVTITATPTATAGSAISSVSFLVNGVSIGTVGGAGPYTISWSPTATGSYTLTATVTDTSVVTSGTTPNLNTGTSPLVIVTLAGFGPTVTLANPGNAIGLGFPVTLTATPAATLPATVSRVDFLSGATVIGSAFSLPYQVLWTPTTAGAISLTARVTDSAGFTATSAAASVNITVPSVAITSPLSGAGVALGATVPLVVTASSVSPATVSKVEFLVGATLVGTSLTPTSGSSYTVNWTPATAGAVSITARVTDSNGAAITSSAVSVTVAASVPSVSITSPANGATVTNGSATTLTATAVASGGATVTRVDFLSGATTIGTALAPTAGSSYSVSWTPNAAGVSTLTARVTDSNGTAVTSSAVNVTVTTATVATISITSPANGTSIVAGAAATLIATAVANSGATVTRVDFFLSGTTTIGTALTPTAGSSYSVSWTPTAAGVSSLTAKLTDSTGAVLTSSAINVTVTAGSAATVAITAPLAGSVVTVGTNVSLAASVAFAAGAGAIVSRVDFFAGPTPVGSATTAPYAVAWTPTAAGAVSLTARMTDSTGATTTSLAVSVTAVVVVPAAALASPINGASLNVGTATTLTATASAGGGATVNRVDFLAGATVVGTVLTAPYSVSWTPTAVGIVALTVRVTDTSGATATSTVVNVTVAASVGPGVTLSLSPNTATVAASTTLPVGATRNILATVTPVAGTAVVRVEFFVNDTKVGEKTTAPYSYRYTAPAATGPYTFSARATDNTGLAREVQLPLTVVTAVGASPTISLLTPTAGAVVVPNTAMQLAASTLASGGSIASVQFYANGSPVGINLGNALVASPYVTSFTPTAPGAYVLDAIATDDRGNTTVSNAVTISATFGTPTISILSPGANATARATPNIPLTITATAAGGSGATVLLVEFLLDGVQIGTRTVGISTGLFTNYSFAWTPTTAQLGLHELTARVTDTNSLSATSTPAVKVNVATIIGTPPTVTITTPNAGTAIQSLSVVNFVANAFATGAGNTLTSVEFFLNDASIGLATREQTTNLWRIAYNLGGFDFSAIAPTTPDANGNQRFPLPLYAIAKDSNNNQTISTTANLTVTQSTSAPPSVQLLSLGGTTVTQGTQFLMLGAPFDSDGTVTALQLFVNGTASGAAIANPQVQTLVTFTPNAAGRFNLYAVATDDTGNTAVSTPSIVLNVTAVNAPNTAITRPSDNATVTTVNAPVFLEGTASGSDITQIPTVQFLVTASTGARAATINAARIGTTSTYRAIWTPTTADTYTIATQATVSNVQASSTASRRVVVNNVIGIAPTVSPISFNPNQTTFTSASTANFNVTATDADGAIQSVEYFLNRNSIGEAARDQLTNVWRLTTSFAGLTLNTATELVAIARDSAGNVTASATTNITIGSATSAPPTVTIIATPGTVAFSQAAQLTALASDPDGSVSSVQYFVNGVSVGISVNPGNNYQVNWTSATSGTFNVYALATDNSNPGNTAISPTTQVTVKRNNPVLDNDAYVLQTFQDIVNRAPNSSELTLYGGLVSSGALTRAALVDTLIDSTSTNVTFTQTTNALAAYYVIMGQWPTTANYTTIFNNRANLGNVCGNVLGSIEYVLKYPEHISPTVALLNNPISVIPADTFLARLWKNAGLPGAPGSLESLRFRSNDTASLTLGIARGYGVVGLNTAVAEFVTNTNVNNTALFNSAKAAALFFMLAKPQVLTDTTNALAGSMTVPALTTRIAALTLLLKPDDVTAVAEASIKDVLYSYRYVTITKHPKPLTVNARSGAIFSVEASGQPPLSYQWLLNGAPISGVTNPSALTAQLNVNNVDGTRTGTYSVAVSTPAGSATSDPATLFLSATPTRLGNISTRGVTGAGGNVLIGGFVVSGLANQNRQMLIRVIGPGIDGAPFNVAGAIADPRLEVYDARGALILQNDNWGTQTGGAAAVTALTLAVTRVGAFTLANNSLDASVLATLTPGNYTVQAKSTNAAATGVVLIEVYDATAGAVAVNSPKAINVSTRGGVGTGANVMIAGFVVNGAVYRRVLIRGVGPTLANFGLPAATLLADPQITLLDANGGTLATNDNWATDTAFAPVIAAASVTGGAFPLANGSKDAALLVMLLPGAYTVQLSGVGQTNNTGIGLVEVYDVDP